MGISRTARALFVVDWTILKHIAKKCWGMTSEIDGDDVPRDWKVPTGLIDIKTVDLKFDVENIEDQKIIIKEMIPLPAYRIPGSKRDLWLLPLVSQTRIDWRKTRIRIAGDSWEDFFDSFGVDLASVNEELTFDEYGIPDERLTDLGKYQPENVVFDVAALSIGLRPFFDPVTNTFGLIDFKKSEDIRNARMVANWIKNPKNNSPTSAMLLAGGRAGKAYYPRGARVFYQKNKREEYKVKQFTRRGLDYSDDNLPPIWTSWVQDNSDSETDEFAQRVVDDAWGWMDSGGQYCFIGLVPPEREITPDDHDPGNPESPQPFNLPTSYCGFDDYFSIQIKENPKNPGEYVFTTRFYELPPLFLPDVLLVNGRRDCEITTVTYGTFEEDYAFEPEGECPPTSTPPRAAIIRVTNPPCDDKNLAQKLVIVYDPMGCIFDHDEEELVGVKVVFAKGTIKNPYFDPNEEVENPEYDPECDPESEDCEPELISNPCYNPEEYLCVWTAIDRCCVEADS
jgi:hypothetical protein